MTAGEPDMDTSDAVASNADPTAEMRINALLALPDGGQSPVTVAAAESLTGGNVSARITAISGSSGYFLGGIVAYSNAAQASLLGVSGETLATRGAASVRCGSRGRDHRHRRAGRRNRAQAGRSGLHRPRCYGWRDHRGVSFPR